MVDTTGFFRRLRDLGEEGGPHARHPFRRLGNRLLIGMLVTFPLLVSLFFLRFAYRVLDSWFHPLSLRLFGTVVPGVGTALALLGLFLVGSLATNVFGGRLLAWVEQRIAKVPLLSPIYQGARQVTEVLQVRGTEQFRRVVLVPFPREGSLTVGFVTRELPAGSAFFSGPAALVFVPTTPNPTSGFVVCYPLSELRPAAITIEEGVKFVVSGGLLVPPGLLSPTPPDPSPSGDG